jgi:hypothetical protein
MLAERETGADEKHKQSAATAVNNRVFMVFSLRSKARFINGNQIAQGASQSDNEKNPRVVRRMEN